jgi:hypothetical protein
MRQVTRLSDVSNRGFLLLNPQKGREERTNQKSACLDEASR